MTQSTHLMMLLGALALGWGGEAVGDDRGAPAFPAGYGDPTSYSPDYDYSGNYKDPAPYVQPAPIAVRSEPAPLAGHEMAVRAPADDSMARRIAELEAEHRALREELARLRENPTRLPHIPATPVSAAPAPEAPPAEEDYFTLDELKSEMKKLAWTKGELKIVPYGAFWGDVNYNTERTVPGPYAVYVRSAQTDPEDEFYVDARRSRFGLNIDGPKVPLLGNASSGAKVEIDFFGDGPVNPNRAGVLLRHAYFDVKNDDFMFLFGQTWDLISPLYPSTLNYAVGWDGGNIGYRRAQARFDRYLKFSDVLMMEVQGSINQDVIPDFATTPGVDREAADWPILEGRLGWVVGHRGKGCKPVKFGISGHIGETEFDFTQVGPAPLNLPPASQQRFRTWSFNADMLVPVGDYVTFKGEFFTGENLSAFLGGIGQGVCVCNRNTIRSTGGWFDVGVDWTDRFHTHAGWGLDDPVNTDFLFGRTYNQFFFVNFTYDVTKNFVTGIEVTSWKTLYQDRRTGQIPDANLAPTRPGEAVVIDWMLKYSF